MLVWFYLEESRIFHSSVQLTSVAQLCPTLCSPMDCSTPGFPVHHYLSVHVHSVGDAIQPSHPLPPSSPFAFSLSQLQGLFQWVDCLHQVAKVLELQYQSIQWIFRVDFLKDWLVGSPWCPRDSNLTLNNDLVQCYTRSCPFDSCLPWICCQSSSARLCDLCDCVSLVIWSLVWETW